jgi:hypothetical protein
LEAECFKVIAFGELQEDVASIISEGCNPSKSLSPSFLLSSFETDNLKSALFTTIHLFASISTSTLSVCNLNLWNLLLSLQHRNALKVAEGDDELESELKAAESVVKSLLRKTSRFPVVATAVGTLAIAAAGAYGFYLLSPENNPWGWDGYILLSKTHKIFGLE